jgi:archaellum component FlaC
MSELKELNGKIDKLLTGFGEFKLDVEKRFDRLEDDIKGIYQKLQEHDKRFDKIESRINTIRKLSAENAIEIADLKDRAT